MQASLFEHAPTSATARDYMQLADERLERASFCGPGRGAG